MPLLPMTPKPILPIQTLKRLSFQNHTHAQVRARGRVQRQAPFYRSMSTTTTTDATKPDDGQGQGQDKEGREKTEWLIIMPDHEGALEKRMSVRPTHFKELKKGEESGFWQFGGALLNDPPSPHAPLSIRGSAMLALASSREEVESALREDVYAREGVWDLSKAQIYPFKSAIRKAM